jgi:multiple sugar transport system permease protein
VGLANYIKIFQQPAMLNSLKNTTIYALSYVSIGLVLGLLVALSVRRITIGQGLLKAVYFFPVFCSLVVISLIWGYMYEPQRGLINFILSKLGIPAVGWLVRPNLALLSIIMVGVWQQLGWNVLVLFAGLQGISSHYYEAANIDGASSSQQFWYITLPLLKPIIIFVLLVQTALGFQVFTQVYIMTQGGPVDSTRTLVQEIYEIGFRMYDMSYASAVSTMFFMIILTIAIVQLKLVGMRGEQ